MSTQNVGTKLGERRSSARAEAAPAYRARREEIIAAAGRAFLVKGYRATSFRDIADAVGVDRASLYYYFESKHELFRAATNVAVERNVDDAESIAASDLTPAEKIAEILQRLLWSYTDRDYPYMFIFLQEDVNGISDDSEDEWAREMNDYNRRYEGAITSVIAEGAERGDFVLAGSPHVLTKAVVGMANWLQHWYRADGPMSAAEIAHVFASTFLYGVMRRDEVGRVTVTPTTDTAPYVNVLDPEFYVDPWDAYRWLRDEAPCFWDPVQRLWVVTRYDDVMAIEKDGARYSSFQGSRPQIDQSADRSMINMDDPTHQEQRKLVARRFNPGGVRGHEDHVRALVTDILDPVVPLGECEVIEAIASRLPAMMIGDLLGYPRDMWELLRHWSERTMTLGGLNMTDGPPYESHPDVVPVMVDFFTQTAELVEVRRAEPRDDLISVWIAQGWETGQVLEETLLLLDGGAETTRTVIGSIIRELALQPDQRRLLVEHPELLSTTAVEEFIRWVTPILNMRRTVTEEHELHGQTLREGDQVVLMYGAANRDPRAFTEPDRLDVTRPDNRHVAFGFGTHFCLGAWLARLELRVMFEELLRRIPEWELVDPDEPQIAPGTFARAYDRIRIRYQST